MNQKLERIINELVEITSAWQGVEAVLLSEFVEEEIYDPYFFISLDIYYKETIPAFEERKQAFSKAAVFESSRANQKDRFLLDNLPVRLEYKNIDDVEQEIFSYTEFEGMYRNIGTYGLFRIDTARVFFSKTGWIDSIRERLKEPRPEFWQYLFNIFRRTTEHYLGDLNAAALQNDPYFFLQSSAGFMQHLSRLLFTINQHFECSGRKMYREILQLRQLPENFVGRYQSFFRQDKELTLERKAEVAELLAKSAISMESVLK